MVIIGSISEVVYVVQNFPLEIFLLIHYLLQILINLLYA